MKEIITYNSESIYKITYVNDTSFSIVYKKNKDKSYIYNCESGYFLKLKLFSENENGLGINRKIKRDINEGRVTKSGDRGQK